MNYEEKIEQLAYNGQDPYRLLALRVIALAIHDYKKYSKAKPQIAAHKNSVLKNDPYRWYQSAEAFLFGDGLEIYLTLGGIRANPQKIRDNLWEGKL